MDLNPGIQKNADYAKFRTLEAEKLLTEKQLEAFKRENAELKERIHGYINNQGFGGAKKATRVDDLTTDDDDLDKDWIAQLIIENKILESEKKKAERDVKAWESKYRALKSWVEKSTWNKERVDSVDFDPESDPRGKGTETSRGPPGSHSNIVDCINEEGKNVTFNLKVGNIRRREAKRRLVYHLKKSPSKKIAPSTPGKAPRPSYLSIVDISDSEEEPNNDHDERNERDTKTAKNPSIASEETLLFSTPKRKWASNMVMSDSESDQEDSIPICMLKKSYLRNNPYGDCTEDSDPDEVVSGSEGESLDGFIVNDSDSDLDEGNYDDLEEFKFEFAEALSTIHGKKDRKYKWEFEADILADLGKDSELCMKAVCALYRRQTSDEKCCKETIHTNGRGFSKFDATRGTDLAEFLTAGNPQGNVVKSVEELEKYDPKAVETCRSLACKYSKQLLDIYETKEDPFFSYA